MVSTILNQTRRFSWPFILSVGLHASLVTGLLYATVSPISKLTTVKQPMAVMLVTSEPQPAPSELKVAPGPFQELPATVQGPKPVLKPKSHSRPKQHREIQSQLLQTDTLQVTPVTSNPLDQLSTVLVRRAPASTGVHSLNNISNAPRVTNRINPLYPPLAKALGIEGRVSVIFDVNADGWVENVQILSAQPRNIFERDIRLAMRRWTYEVGKPAINLTVNFKFDLKKVSNSS